MRADDDFPDADAPAPAADPAAEAATPVPASAWTARSLELADLLARTGLGDRAAFGRLYRLTSGHLLAVVLRIQRERAVAEELLQEIYLNVWRAAGSFSASQSQPMTWLTRIARNRAIDSLRRAQVRPQAAVGSASAEEDEDLDLLAQQADDGPGPAELLAQASDARALGHCMQGLSAAQRQSLALAFYDGLSHAEVADHLQQPLGTVKSWVRRALSTLKSCLEAGVARDAAASAARG